MKRMLINILSAIFITSIVPLSVYAANPASFTLSSSSSSVHSGSTFNLSISENGDSVTVVTMKLNFDSAKLQLISSTCSGSFSNKINETNGLTCYSSGGTSVSGSTLAATISFQALVGSGTTTITMASSSMIATNGSDIWNHSTVSKSINLTTPEQSTPTQTPPPSTSTTNSTTTATTQSNPQPVATKPSNTSQTAQATGTTAQDTATNNPSTLGSTDISTPAEVQSEDQTQNDNTSNLQLLNTLLPLILAFLVAGSLVGWLLYGTRKQAKPAKKGKKKVSKKSTSNRKKPISKKAKSGK